MAKDAKGSSVTEVRWTAAQLTAIEHVEGNLLISAAAGSGKTAVLAERCARLVTRDGPGRSSIDRLLVLTFTEAAAGEMRTRIAGALRKKAEQATGPDAAWLRRQVALVDRAPISTLHAFCQRTLRTYFHEARIDPAFEIIDPDEAEILKDETIASVLETWHRKPANDSPGEKKSAAAFADLYEAYAQGRDSTLAELIRKMHTMLSTVKDPETWLAGAREKVSAKNAPVTLARYLTQTAAELELYISRYGRQIAYLQTRDGCQAMATRLAGFRDTLAEVAANLAAGDPDLWNVMAAQVRSFEWGRLNTEKSVPDFEVLKKQIFETAKEDHKKLLATTFSEFQTSHQLLADLHALAAPLEMLLQLTRDFQTEFAAAKTAQNRLDFADLERHTLQLLTTPNSPVAADLRQRFDHLLVDEFQDVNPLQAALLEQIRDARKHAGRGNLFVVGDVKQSIYGFRLADPGEFLQLEIAARQTTGAFLALQHNFRSRPDLLGYLNLIFHCVLTPALAGIDYSSGHALFPPETSAAQTPAVPKTPTFTQSPIELHVITTGNTSHDTHDDQDDSDAPPPDAVESEARLVARRIIELLADTRCIRDKTGHLRRTEFRDVAILLRGARDRATTYARVLAEHGIPVHAELSTGFFAAEEVQYTLAYLALLDNPLQDIPLVTALLSPLGRFTHDDMARIRLAFPNRREIPFHQALQQFMNGPPPLPPPDPSLEVTQDATLLPRLKTFFAQLERHRLLARTTALHDTLAEIYQQSHLLTYVSGLPAGTQRAANLQALYQRALQFSNFRRQGLHRFLRFIDRLRQRDADDGEAPVLSEASNVVRIMTIHKAKGLEFPIVFVASLGTPFRVDKTGPVLLDRDEFVGLWAADIERNVFRPTATSELVARRRARSARAEELRLLYVALTRARDHLILTGTIKEATFDRLISIPHDPTTALPEDLLLRGRCFLDYLLPLVAGGGLAGAMKLQRHDAPPTVTPITIPSAQIQITSLQNKQPLPMAPSTPGPHLAALISRLTTAYPHETLTRQPGLMSVSQLKKQETSGEEDPPADWQTLLAPHLRQAAPIELPAPRWRFDDMGTSLQPAGEAARTRGTATHRVLELLGRGGFARVTSAPALDQFMEEMLAQKQLTPEDAALAARPEILWFLQSPLGRQLAKIAAATPAAPNAGLFPELRFVYSAPPLGVTSPKPDLFQESPLAASDHILIRGAMDLLIVDAAGAEIIDYKTDAGLTQLPAYRIQMSYYARAVEAILKSPVRCAHLVFLMAHHVETLEHPAP